MRMDFLFGNFFWGLLVILLGLSIFLRGFHIYLPLVKVFIAIIIIMFGVKILIGGGKTRVHTNRPTYKHGTTRNYNRNRQEYEFVFSGGTLDLTKIQPDSKDLEITVVFGAATVILPAHIKFNIEPSTVFGATYLPHNSYFGFGEDDTTLNDEGTNQPIHIESTAVFGRIEYVVKDVNQPAGNAAEADSTAPPSDF